MARRDEYFDRFAQHQWRRFEAVARRGWGGWGRGGPGHGDWGGGSDDNFRVGRMLASGDLRLIALYFIEQQPRHGYDLIKAIEEKTGGIVPSPGVVYPALTFLEEAGYVTSTAEANKRLYTITAEGKAHLDENRQAVEATLTHLGRIGERAQHLRARLEEADFRRRDPREPGPDHDLPGVAPAVNDARRALKHAIREASRNRNPDGQRQLADILRRAAEDIARIAPGPSADPDADIDI